jgi:hypothetical protein
MGMWFHVFPLWLAIFEMIHLMLFGIAIGIVCSAGKYRGICSQDVIGAADCLVTKYWQ